MGRASARRRASPVAEIAAEYPIIDVVEVRTSYGAPAPGFVLVLGGFTPPDPDALSGTSVGIHVGEGWTILGEIAGIRDHGPAASILLENWPDGFPRPKLGWMVEIPELTTSIEHSVGGRATEASSSIG